MNAVTERLPIRPGLLSAPLDLLEQVRLMGSRCPHCAETTLGSHTTCPNCGNDGAQPTALSNRGTLWTYTVVRHQPPGEYKGPKPFAPFVLGLVELPDGLRVMAPVDVEPSQANIGMSLQLHVFVRDVAEVPAVVSFSFRPA